jgi:site-specific DNA recombinase
MEDLLLNATEERTTKMETVAIYCRVSTKKQEKHGISLSAQEAKCRQYCKMEGLKVVFVGIESESAKDTNRAVFKQIEQLIARKQIQHVATVKQDRLNRDAEDSSRIFKLMDKKNVTPHFVCEGGKKDLKDPNVRFMLGINGLLSEHERSKISLNTRIALSHKRDLGQRVSGSAPYGYQFVNGLVVKNADEQSVITKIHELHSTGLSLRKIISRLASEGVLNRAGNPFTVRAVHNIVLAKAA